MSHAGTTTATISQTEISNSDLRVTYNGHSSGATYVVTPHAPTAR